MIIEKISDLLEKYIQGKDLDKYQILEEIYCSTAIVSFEIKAGNIKFPDEVHGNIEIAKVLSADFNKTYDLVKTYYLSSYFPDIDKLVISEQNWLVIMRDRANGNIQVGTGYYNWEFENQNDADLKIKSHKIFIYAMLELPSEALYLLKKVQENLKYPWVEKKKVTEVLKQYEELSIITNYLK